MRVIIESSEFLGYKSARDHSGVWTLSPGRIFQDPTILIKELAESFHSNKITLTFWYCVRYVITQAES